MYAAAAAVDRVRARLAPVVFAPPASAMPVVAVPVRAVVAVSMMMSVVFVPGACAMSECIGRAERAQPDNQERNE